MSITYDWKITGKTMPRVKNVDKAALLLKVNQLFLLLPAMANNIKVSLPLTTFPLTRWQPDMFKTRNRRQLKAKLFMELSVKS